MSRLMKMVLGNIPRLIRIYFLARRRIKHPEKYSEMAFYTPLQSLLRRVIVTGNVDLQIFGRENIPENNGFMIYANHQGIFDPIAIGSDFRGPLAAVYKHELKKVFFINEIAGATGSIPLDREDIRQSLTVIRAVTEELKKGRNYIIFPEGTRSKNGNVMGEFHGGSFKAAMKAKCPILPVAYINSFQVLDRKGSQPVTVQMHYLKPIPYEEYQGMTTVALAALVKQRIQAILDQYA